MKKLTDLEPMPFGKYKGRRMQEVPADYLDWLRGQPWLGEWPAVAEYIARSAKAIDWELTRADKEIDGSDRSDRSD